MPKPKRDTGTEVVAAPQNDRRQRRRFAPEDKARILREAEGCTERGQLAALLRREGIYSSHLTSWRVLARREGEAGLAAKKPGPKPTKDAKDKIIERLEKQKARLEKELRISRKLIELQVNHLGRRPTSWTRSSGAVAKTLGPGGSGRQLLGDSYP